MLVGNAVRLSASNPMRQFGAASVGSIEQACWMQNGPPRNLWVGDALVTDVTDHSAYPNGYLHPGAWHLPQKSGGIASYTQLQGEGDITGNLAGGLAAEATIAGVGAVDADLMGLGIMLATIPGVGALTADLIATGALVATLPGTGALVADMVAVINAVATLAGVGAITGTLAGAASIDATLAGVGAITGNLAGGAQLAATLAGVGAIDADLMALWNMQATLSGSGAIVTAGLTALANAVATLSGTGTIAGTSTLTGLGFMEAVITACQDEGCATPDQIADAVWEAVVADYATNGTFGFAVGLLYYLGHHKVITDPVAGTYEVYADDDTTVIFTGALWEDAAGTQPYQGQGAERRDRLTP